MADTVMDQIVYWTQIDQSSLGRPQLEGNTPNSSLAAPMMLLFLIQQFCVSDEVTYKAKFQHLAVKCIHDCLRHVQRGDLVLENVGAEGQELPGSVGRLMVPGHAIEGGWILLRMCNMFGKPELKEKVNS